MRIVLKESWWQVSTKSNEVTSLRLHLSKVFILVSNAVTIPRRLIQIWIFHVFYCLPELLLFILISGIISFILKLVLVVFGAETASIWGNRWLFQCIQSLFRRLILLAHQEGVTALKLGIWPRVWRVFSAYLDLFRWAKKGVVSLLLVFDPSSLLSRGSHIVLQSWYFWRW